jgi:hypothetical protein
MGDAMKAERLREIRRLAIDPNGDKVPDEARKALVDLLVAYDTLSAVAENLCDRVAVDSKYVDCVREALP